MAYEGKTIGLALSGGGFRATLFGLGSLLRLNELGLLGLLDRVTSVSGGSILAAFLGSRWKELSFEDGICRNFEAVVARPLRDFCGRTLDIRAGLEGIFSPFTTAGEALAARYDRDIFHGATIRDLPVGPGRSTPATGPDFVIYATNMQTGRSFRFTRNYVADYYIGINREAVFPLATAVAASSAFPPVFSPVKIEARPGDWQNAGLKHPRLSRLQEKIILADGGVYDNMGLEALLGNVDIVLVSDAGAPFEVEPYPLGDYFSQLGRVRDILIGQTRALRKRWLIQDFKDRKHSGTYWGIGTHIANYQVPSIVGDTPTTEALQSVRTRLNKFTDREQGHLINWGYALCDAAVRKHVIPGAPQAVRLPVPEYPL